MKTSLSLLTGTALIGAMAIGAAPAVSARSLEMVVIAEHPDSQAAAMAPSPGHPVYFVAFDGGYIEAGDPIANEQPPGAAAVSQALQRALASAGYQPATAADPPAIAFIYHWGLLNRDSFAIHDGPTIDPNLHARLSLVTTRRQDGEIESYLLDNRMLKMTNPGFGSRLFLGFQERDALELSRDDRYFAVLSTYDYSSLLQNRPQLLWRVKMSTRGVGASMADALPTLLQGGMRYLGQNLTTAQYLKVPLIAGAADESAAEARRFAPPLGVTGPLNRQFLRGLMRKEHDEFSGTHAYEKGDYQPILAAAASPAASSGKDNPP